MPRWRLLDTDGPPPKKFAKLSEQEFNQLFEQRHPALEDGPKKQQTGMYNMYQPFEVMHSANLEIIVTAI